VELRPFQAAIAADVATMMTAHVLMPALDEKAPATLSRRIVSDVLRHELGFEGVILSDDLEMKAIANAYTPPSAAVLAVAAGCDGVLICGGDHAVQAASLEALIHGVEGGELPLARVDDALRRQHRAKSRFLSTTVASRPLERQALQRRLGREDHRAIADEMARFA
jgi:beta-N-acetylhexosaminidase